MIYSLKEISKKYSTRNGAVHSLDSVTFDVRRGERVALIGPSGAGKTTLFRLLNATLRPTSGELRFDGADVGAMSARSLREIRRRIGTIYQQHHLVPSLTALENTLCGKLGQWSFIHTLRNIIKPAPAEEEQAMAALDAVGLADKRRARADELSGGQQQRLAIARVLMQDPDVILADEPFASLDPALTESIASLLLSLVDGGNRTMVVTLHDVEMAVEYFPRLVALREGRIVFDRPSTEIERDALDALYGGNSNSTEKRDQRRSDQQKSDEQGSSLKRERNCAR
ncbi:MAG TPA: phosphonate ABC transporter ATP-binding protein [Blastocatellia bacterium]|jgi:phosphonate transport system ATP-binding protein